MQTKMMTPPTPSRSTKNRLRLRLGLALSFGAACMLISWTLAIKLAYTLGPGHKPTSRPTPIVTVAEHHVSTNVLQLAPGIEGFPYLAAGIAIALIAIGIGLVRLHRHRVRPDIG